MTGAPRTLSLTGAPLGRLLEVMRSGSAADAEDAWAECFRQYHERVWRRVFYVVRTTPWLREPDETAADVTGQVFLGLPAAARNYREVGRSEPWLMQLAVRAALRHRESITGNWFSGRRRNPSAAPGRGRSYVSIDELVHDIADVVDIAESDARFDLRRRLQRWQSDPARQRFVPFIELFLAGHGHEEIARRLGVSAATSRTWLWQIRQQLAAGVEEEEEMTRRDQEVSGRHGAQTPVISILPRLDAHPDLDELQRHADATLDAERSLVVDAHVGGCAGCAQRVQHLRLSLAMLAAASASPPDLFTRIQQRRKAGERPLLPGAAAVLPRDDVVEVAGRDVEAHATLSANDAIADQASQGPPNP